MIDWDDADDWAFFSLFWSGWFGGLCAIIAVICCIYACSNERECEQMRCDRGKPSLIKGQCLCVEKAVSQ